MSQTNFNRYIQLVFDRPIVINDASIDVTAFSLYGQQRDYYGGPLVDKIWTPEMLQYAKNANGLDVENVLLIIFPDSMENFRKSEGVLTLHYDASVGSLYGATDIDMLPDSDFTFVAQNTDMFQNPQIEETVRTQTALIATVVPHKLVTIKTEASAEMIKAQTTMSYTLTPTLVGEIRP